jgi:hypothetical protein
MGASSPPSVVGAGGGLVVVVVVVVVVAWLGLWCCCPQERHVDWPPLELGGRPALRASA